MASPWDVLVHGRCVRSGGGMEGSSNSERGGPQRLNVSLWQIWERIGDVSARMKVFASATVFPRLNAD